jgi:hypothetical protein
MAPKSNYLIGGAALLAAMIVALPAAKGIGARKEAPLTQVNRAAKGDRYVQPRTIAVRKPPVSVRREPISMRTPKAPERPTKPEKIMDGCEPLFSPVVVPSMAHLAGRCVG